MGVGIIAKARSAFAPQARRNYGECESHVCFCVIYRAFLEVLGSRIRKVPKLTSGGGVFASLTLFAHTPAMAGIILLLQSDAMAITNKSTERHFEKNIFFVAREKTSCIMFRISKKKSRVKQSAHFSTKSLVKKSK